MMIFICGILKLILTTFAKFLLQMGNSAEYISYNCVLFSYSHLLPGTPESGGIASPVLSTGKQRARR